MGKPTSQPVAGFDGSEGTNWEAIFQDRHARVLQSDRNANRRWRGSDDRIVVVRHPLRQAGFHDCFLGWLAANFPDLRRRFELALLPGTDIELAGVRLLVTWLQDPVEAWSPKSLAMACRLVDRCSDLGVPTINHPARLANAGKREAADRLGAIGIRTPRTLAIDRARAAAVRADLPGTILIREDWQHGAASLRLAPDDPIDIEALDGYVRPIAVEFIDTRDGDGLYRKYRCLIAGEHGISVHLLAARDWEVRGENKLSTPDLLAEEAAHIAGADPNRTAFVRARDVLELDFVAFDYGRLPDGGIVVWEANAYPFIQFGPRAPALLYRDASVHRSFAAMVGLYLDRAGIPVPEAIEILRRYDAPEAKPLLARLAVG